jgi:uncharacterized membrane-anchored protein YjiN (DUF445 family)
MADLGDPRRAPLRRLKRQAVALLVLMLAGFWLSHAMGNQGVWAWTRAFCEAATVGALADWFAVVALFRRPMGLPIPHTAIIPANKARVADNLAAFVRNHFLDPAVLLAKLEVFDPAARLGAWLGERRQARLTAQTARSWALQALSLLDEPAVRDAIQGFVLARLRAWNAAGTAGEVLALLTRDGRHQALLDEALKRLGEYLSQDEVKQRASEVMVRYARKEWPRMVGTVNLIKPVDGIADSMAERLANALLDELQAVLSEPAHPLRQDYEQWVAAYLERLRDDPALVVQVAQIKARLLDHPLLREYVQGLWQEVQQSLRQDLSRKGSVLTRHLTHALLALGQRLGQDPALRHAINAHVLGSARALADGLREGVTTHIAQTVKSWDERHLVDELELSVGADLQYIRFNGTLVGGLIGVALHAMVVLVGL